MSLMGVVMLVGIAVSNSILIVEFTRHLRQDGMAVREAVALACRVRLAPGADDVAGDDHRTDADGVEAGAGSESYAPLARAIIGGLTSRDPDGIPGAGGLLPVYRDRGPGFGALAGRRLTDEGTSSICRCSQAPHFGQQETIHLTLQEAEKAALQNNPQVSSARYLAEASKEVPKEYQAAYQPTVFGSVTGAGASDGSRIAAGALNNPIIYNRFASGIGVSQLITDFGRTGNLVDSARYRSKAQEETSRATRAQVLVGVDRAYFAVLRAQSLLNVAQQTVAARQLVADQIGALAKNALKSAIWMSASPM